MNIRHTLVALVALVGLVAAPAVANAQQAIYSYNTGNANLAAWGTKKAEYYDLAVKVDGGSLAGKTITRITVPFAVAGNDGISNVSVWLSTELGLESNSAGKRVASANIAKVEGTIDATGTLDVTLPEPYTITADGVYVGYSFQASNVSGAYADNATPLALVVGANEGGLWMHTTRTYMKWSDKSASLGGSVATQVYIDGVPANVADLASVGEVVVPYNAEGSATVKVTNYGNNAINDIDVAYTVGNVSGTQHIALDAPLAAVLGSSAKVSFAIPAVNEKGSKTLTATVTKVNGQDNASTSASADIAFRALSFVPVHRPVMEEYTGLWCGWCPRGFLGLERMNAAYPDTFVGISYHNGDDMEITSNFPSSVAGFPAAWLDRNRETDAYLGDNGSDYSFAFDKVWLETAAQPVLFDVKATAELSADGATVDGTATITAAAELKDVNYGVEFVLTADELSDPSWGQSNYYASYNYWSDGAADWEPFTGADAASTVYGLKFNDVIVASSRLQGKNASVTGSFADEEAKSFDFSFTLADALNTSNKPVIQSTDHLNFIVLLTNPANGSIVNAYKAHVATATAISGVAADKAAAGQAEYYDLSGRRLGQPQKGITIVRQANGQTVKVVTK